MDVKTLCLGALTMGNATGYEIRKMFDEGPFGHFYDAGYGSIYPALNALLKEGLVSVTHLAQDKRPDKKVYQLTDTGMAVFKQALSEPATKDRCRSEHMVRLFFADYLTKSDLEAVYDSYLSHFQEILDVLNTKDCENIPKGRLFAFNFGKTFYQSMATYLIENKSNLFDNHVSGRPRDNAEQSVQEGLCND